jgi:hypothetical protein
MPTRIRLASYALGLALLALVGVPAVYAGNSSGPVTMITYANTSGGIVVFTAGTHVSKPPCHVAPDDGWSITLTTAEEKALYALILAAAGQRARFR